MTPARREVASLADRRRSAGGHPQRAEDGFTVAELAVGMLLLSIVMAIALPILTSVSSSTAEATGNAAGSASANLAMESLSWQIGSASEICLPTTLTQTGLTVAPGFAVRALSESYGTTRWDQWMVNPTTKMLQEQIWSPTWTTSQAVPPWVNVTGPILNATTDPPFAPVAVASGAPQSLTVHLVVADSKASDARTVSLRGTIVALDTPYAPANPPQLCGSTDD